MRCEYELLLKVKGVCIVGEDDRVGDEDKAVAFVSGGRESEYCGCCCWCDCVKEGVEGGPLMAV